LINRTKRALGLLAGAAVSFIITGCGGGGGGGGTAPADITGRIVLVSSGAPLAGAVVSVGGTTQTTLADGVFTLRNIPSTGASLSVTATGIQALTQPLTNLTANKSNDLGDVYVLNTTDTGGYTATVKGQVVRSDTLAAISGAKVVMSGHITTSDSSGNFTLTGLPVGLGNAGTQVGLVTAATFEDKQIFLDFPLIGTADNNIGQILVSPPVGGIPGGPFNIKGKISLTGQTDLSGTIVTLINKDTGATVGTFTTGTDGLYGFFVIVGHYTVKAEHAGPPSFTPKTQDVNLDHTDIPVTVSFTL
jgi:hypothetical protein